MTQNLSVNCSDSCNCSVKAIIWVSCVKRLKKNSCSTELTMKFQLLINMKNSESKEVLCSKQLSMKYFLLLNVKMPNFGILTFIIA